MPTLQQNKAASFSNAILSERLSAIAESLPRGGVVCDVGSDHGLLPLYLLENGYCARAIVTDLNELPLQRAEKNLSLAGFSHCCQFVLTDGICDVLPMNPDAIVIAGMGGETIAGILERAEGRISKDTFLALQPMTRPHFLRKFLYENGFCILEERVVAENKKLFHLIFAKFDGISRKGDDLLYYFGEHLPKSREKAVISLWKELLRQINQKIAGKTEAKQDVSYEKEIQSRLLAMLEESNENM